MGGRDGEIRDDGREGWKDDGVMKGGRKVLHEG